MLLQILQEISQVLQRDPTIKKLQVLYHFHIKRGII